MLIAQHPERQWNVCMSDDDEDEIELILTD